MTYTRGVEIAVPPATWRDLDAIAHERQSLKRPAGVRSQRHADADDLDIERIGLLGEWAVIHGLLNLPYAPRLHLGGDAGWDGEIRGQRIEVKTPLRPSHRFFHDITKKPTIGWDVGVLSHVADAHTVRIRGWITAPDFRARAEPTDFGYGPRLVLAHAHLLPPVLLPTWLADTDRYNEPCTFWEPRQDYVFQKDGARS